MTKYLLLRKNSVDTGIYNPYYPNHELTEENIKEQTKKMDNEFTEDQDSTSRALQKFSAIHIEKNGCGQYVPNGELEKMQKDYNELVETVTKTARSNKALQAELNELKITVEDQRENLGAARKLRKQHERQIKLLEAELDAANAWKQLEQAKLVQQAVNAKVKRLADESMELNAAFENLKKRYAPPPAFPSKVDLISLSWETHRSHFTPPISFERCFCVSKVRHETFQGIS